MRFEHDFSFSLLAPAGEAASLLLAPERVFARLPGIESLTREGDELSGRVCGEALLFGRVCFPFKSRLRGDGGSEAVLEPLPLDEDLWAELSGRGRAEGGEIRYRVKLVLHAQLPSGEKWGGKALVRMVEAAIRRSLERTLSSLPQRLEYR